LRKRRDRPPFSQFRDSVCGLVVLASRPGSVVLPGLASGHAHRGGSLSAVVPFLPRNVFDDAATRLIGEAFDAACKELHDTGQPELVHEVMAKRIIAAAADGERNVARLRDIALAGLRDAKNRL